MTVFSPGAGDHSGTGGAGFIVDLAVDATGARGNSILTPASGYQPFFNDPSSTTFHPGPDHGAPGLLVLLSTTPDKPETPLQGPDTNLAGLFCGMIGVARGGFQGRIPEGYPESFARDPSADGVPSGRGVRDWRSTARARGAAWGSGVRMRGRRIAVSDRGAGWGGRRGNSVAADSARSWT